MEINIFAKFQVETGIFAKKVYSNVIITLLELALLTQG